MKCWLIIITGLALACAAYAADASAPAAPASAGELDSAISDVITQPEYAWRLARRKESVAETGLWGSFFDNIYEWAKGIIRPVWKPIKKCLKWMRKLAGRFARWLDSLFTRDSSPSRRRASWGDGVRLLLFLVFAAALSFLAILLLRMWRNRNKEATQAAVVARPTAADILEERVAADELPMDEWMSMAREFLENGEFRLAVRAMFLGCLVYLANREKITIARHKSNREYIRELTRRAHDAPDVLAAFSENVGILERLWYGMHKATEEAVTAFSNNQERIVGVPQRATVPPAMPQV